MDQSVVWLSFLDRGGNRLACAVEGAVCDLCARGLHSLCLLRKEECLNIIGTEELGKVYDDGEIIAIEYRSPSLIILSLMPICSGCTVHSDYRSAVWAGLFHSDRSAFEQAVHHKYVWVIEEEKGDPVVTIETLLPEFDIMFADSGTAIDILKCGKLLYTYETMEFVRQYFCSNYRFFYAFLINIKNRIIEEFPPDLLNELYDDVRLRRPGAALRKMRSYLRSQDTPI